MLPQRRKSAEEIAKLREGMGHPGMVPETALPDQRETQQQVADPASPVPDETASWAPARLEESEPATPKEPKAPKVVKSLRRSERVPLAAPRATSSSEAGGIPARRHSEQELLKMRNQVAAPPEQTIAFIGHIQASKWLIFLDYFLTVLAFLSAWLSKSLSTVLAMDFPAVWIADIFLNPSTPAIGKNLMLALSVAAMVLAGWIAWKKPRSRHHAGFVTIITVLIVTFGIIYHQPLPNGP